MKIAAFLYISVFFIVFACVCPAQQWSDPINVSNYNNHDGLPDICIDHDGVLHCVWVRLITLDYRCVFYSKSLDQGQTWLNPINISNNTSGAVNGPMIVSDSHNYLYVAYEYDMNNPSYENLYFTMFDGYSWSPPVTIASLYPGLFFEEMTVDYNDRVYVFWRYFDHKPHYRYYQGMVWSGYYTLYSDSTQSLHIRGAVSDHFNNLHCVGWYHNENNDTAKAAYFYYDNFNNLWHSPVVVGKHYYNDPFEDIAVNETGEPYLVWREYADWWKATIYKFKTSGVWSQNITLIQDTLLGLESIDIINSNPAIIDCEKEGDNYKIVFYMQDNNGLWFGQEVFSNPFISPYDLLHDSTYIYILLTGKIDDPDELNIYLIRAKIDDIFTATKEIAFEDNPALLSLDIYPNPFTHETNLEISLKEAALLDISIYNVMGNIIKGLLFENKPPGEYRIVWNGKDLNGKEVPPGFYLVRSQAGRNIVTRPVIKLK